MGSEFDKYAGDYNSALNQGLKLTGESSAYFARGRVRWVTRRLAASGLQPNKTLDFGSGTGGALPFLFELPGCQSVVAVDISADSLAEAKRLYPQLNVSYHLLSEYQPPGNIDLAYCNGVFHHIPLAERAAAVATVFASLKPGGYFALWENNAWNPMTRLIMSRVPFDHDAILVWPSQARALLRNAGFVVERTDFLFIFPSFLSALRYFEPCFARIPLGGQYMVLGRKPE